MIFHYVCLIQLYFGSRFVAWTQSCYSNS